MTIKYGEIGKGIYVNASEDISAFTELTLKFTLGSQTFTRTSADGVSAPNVNSPALPPDPASGFPGGVLPANTYALYTTAATDWGPTAFDQAGNWTICLTYEDAAPTLLHGDDSILTITEGC